MLAGGLEKVAEPGMAMMHGCNPETWEAKAREFQVQGQPQLHDDTLSQKKKPKQQQEQQNRWGMKERNKERRMEGKRDKGKEGGKEIGREPDRDREHSPIKN